MPVSANEQYLLELINRARLDPVAEANRLGIPLDQGLDPGTIQASPMQVLAPNAQLQAAADAHSAWMLQANSFSHTGANGSDPGTRMRDAGYVFSGSWAWGENIALVGTTGTLDAKAAITNHYVGLFDSAPHRENTLNPFFAEIGAGQQVGTFSQGGNTYNASALTEDFAKSGSKVFLTGVAYHDGDGDHFYSIGEGTANVSFELGSASVVTASAGGYALGTTPGQDVTVTVRANGTTSVVDIDLSHGNVKLDLVDSHFETSGSLTLVSGLADATLLGAGAIDLQGNGAANLLTGNNGANAISGGGGNDRIIAGQGDDSLRGDAGNDRLFGGGGRDVAWGGAGSDKIWGHNGNDRLYGGGGKDVAWGGGGHDKIWGQGGHDQLFGGTGNDKIWGQVGNDEIWGEAGNDQAYGGSGADSFIFRKGDDTDHVNDFSIAENDSLHLGDDLWSGLTLTAAQVVSSFAQVTDGSVVLDFGNGDSLTLDGVSSLDGLAAHIFIDHIL